MTLSLRSLLTHPTLLGLIGLSALAFGIGLERLVGTWRDRRRMARSHQRILEQLGLGKITMAQAVNTTSPAHTASALFDLILASGTEAAAAGKVRRAYSQAVRQVQVRLWILGSIASIAPFVGLLGTVLGVMHAFEDIGTHGAGGFDVVSAGISEALITTAVGIFVGIEAVLLFNTLKVRVADYAAELREAVEEVSEALQGATPAGEP